MIATTSTPTNILITSILISDIAVYNTGHFLVGSDAIETIGRGEVTLQAM
jgi:hypothetical protein